MPSSETVKVCLVQHSPVHMNAMESAKKAVRLFDEAAANGAQLVSFGETWLPGYPAWLDSCPNVSRWDHDPVKKVYARLSKNSVTVPGPEVALLQESARKHGIVVLIGVNERVESGPGNGTLYNSLLIINEKGEIASHHRKLMPTYTERLVHGIGDGHGLNTVETGIGKVGGLICWEHWMPHTRQSLHLQGEHIHVAMWPTAHEMHQVASRHYAFEGRCFVLAVGQIMKGSDIPEELEKPQEAIDDPNWLLMRGGSSVIGPDGKYIVEPVYDREELIYAELPMDKILEERMTLDVAGHYNRNDVFTFSVNRNRHT